MSTTHKYGMMTDQEAGLLDSLLLDIKNKFGEIRFLEIGTCGGGTTRGIYQRAAEIDCPIHCEGVDILECYRMDDAPEDYVFHIGDSMDMWKGITRKDFNLLFIDGCHCVNHAACDFLNYSPFVAVGGFCLFHDTAPNANGTQGEWPQNHGYAGQPPAVLGVRSALEKIGLLQGHRKDWRLVHEIQETEFMGMTLFAKERELV